MNISKITLRDVNCSWGHDGVDDLRPFDSPKTVELKRKEPVFLTGDNGTGKTSFLKSILGVVPEVSGTVIVHTASGEEQGCALSKFGDWKIPTVYVPQKPSEMFPRATLVRTVMRAWAEWGRRKTSDKGVMEFAEDLGVATFISEVLDVRVETLSGGQAHILSLFLAALRNPTLILLDEPTAAISDQRRANVIDLVQKLANLGPEGNFVLVATHDKQFVGSSSRVVIFKLS